MIGGRALSRNRRLEPSRRAFVAGGVAGLVAGSRRASAEEPIRAIAFDAFPIFDSRSIGTLARTLLPHDGDKLVAAWTQKLFGYTWLVTAGEHYQSFEHLAEASLIATAAASRVELSDDVRRRLVGAYHVLDVWPDVHSALDRLRRANIKLAILSNLGEATLRDNMRRNALTDAFDLVLSTDQVRRFKPAPQAYAMAERGFGLPRSAIGFAAFGGWDAVGATWYGYRTAWINRATAPREVLGTQPAVVASGMEGVLALAGLV